MFLLSQLLTHRYKVHSRPEKRDILLPSSSLLATKCHSIFFRYKLKEYAVVIYRVYKRVVMSVKFMVANAPYSPESSKRFVHAQYPCVSLATSLTLSEGSRSLPWVFEEVINGSRYLSCQTNSILCRERRAGEFESVPLVELDYNGNGFFLSLLSCFATLITIHITVLYAKNCDAVALKYIFFVRSVRNYGQVNLLWFILTY